jgi:hypothetical protein
MPRLKANRRRQQARNEGMPAAKQNRAQQKNRDAAENNHAASPVYKGNLLKAQLAMLESVNWFRIVHA